MQLTSRLGEAGVPITLGGRDGVRVRPRVGYELARVRVRVSQG